MAEDRSTCGASWLYTEELGRHDYTLSTDAGILYPILHQRAVQESHLEGVHFGPSSELRSRSSERTARAPEPPVLGKERYGLDRSSSRSPFSPSRWS